MPSESVAAPLPGTGGWTSGIPRGERIFVLAACAAYLGAAVPLINPYIGNSDLIGYISVAKKILAGNFRDAVNGYWSPLFSWLLTPFLALRIDAVVAAKILSVLSGLFLSLAAYALAFRFRLSAAFRAAVLLILMPTLLVVYVLIAITPDALVAAILMVYLYVLYDPGFPRRKRRAALCGILGGLAYLAKVYAFFFFLAHFLFTQALEFLQAARGPERRRRIVGAAVGVLALAAVSLPWAAAVSVKYGGPMLGTSGRINTALHGPDAKGHPQAAGGFIPPPNPTAIISWEDTSYNTYIDWSPFQSKKDFRYWLGTIGENVLAFGALLREYSILGLLILAAGGTAAVLHLVRRQKHSPPLQLLSALAVYAAGYLAVDIQDRYLLPVFVLIVLLGLVVLRELVRIGPLRGKIAGGALLAVFVVSFWEAPAHYLPRHLGDRRSFSVAPLKYSDRQVFQISRAIRLKYGLRGSFAANVNQPVNEFIAYYLNMRYFGIMREKENAAGLESELGRYPIDYFFLWFEDGSRFPFLQRHRELTRGRFPELKIYDLRSRRGGTEP